MARAVLLFDKNGKPLLVGPQLAADSLSVTRATDDRPPADLTASGTLSASLAAGSATTASGAVALALGSGQQSWIAELGGTFANAGTTVVFEASISTNPATTDWVGITATLAGGNGSDQGSTVGGTGTQTWIGLAGGWAQVRVRSNAVGGADSVAVLLRASTAVRHVVIAGMKDASGNLKVAVQGTQAMGGDVAAGLADSGNPVKVGGKYNATPPTLSDGQRGDVQLTKQGEQKVAGGVLELPGLTAAALNADLVPSTDVGPYGRVSLQVAGAFSGLLTLQGSNDNVNFVTASLSPPNATATLTPASQIAGAILLAGGTGFRYFRVRMTTYTSGTATGTFEALSAPTVPPSLPVSANQAGTWTIQPGNTPNTTPWLVQEARLNAPVAAGVGTAVVVVKASAGFLASIVCTATGSADLVLYDNASAASGTILAVIPATATRGQIFALRMPASAGITAGQVSGTPAVTVAYS